MATYMCSDRTWTVDFSQKSVPHSNYECRDHRADYGDIIWIYCSVWQFIAIFAVCCSVLQCVAVSCSVLQCVRLIAETLYVICSVLHCVAVCCSVCS